MANLQQFTIGVEEEYMILDPSSKELKSHQKTIVIEGEKKFKDKINKFIFIMGLVALFWFDLFLFYLIK